MRHLFLRKPELWTSAPLATVKGYFVVAERRLDRRHRRQPYPNDCLQYELA